MPSFKTMKELEKYINANLKQVLADDVGKGVVRPKIKENIQTEVYDKYEQPVVYERRKDDGGLTDDDNITVTMVDDNTVSIESSRMDDGRNVGLVVETGEGYNEDWYFPYTHKGRPYMQKTKDDLMSDGSVKRALVQGMKRKGFDIK